MPRTALVRTGETIGSGEPQHFNPYRVFCARLPHMIDEAQNARLAALELSKSTTRRPPNHRDFYVGCSLVAAEARQRAVVDLSAYNTMPKSSSKNVCAERRDVDRIEKLARDTGDEWWALGMVVMGDPQPDRFTGNAPETLWPCGEMCWDKGLIKNLPLDCVIVTVRPDKRKAQVQTSGHMDTFYTAVVAGEDPSEPPLVHHTPQEWAETVDRFDALFPRDMDPLASLENRALAVDATIMAIQGITLSLVR